MLWACETDFEEGGGGRMNANIQFRYLSIEVIKYYYHFNYIFFVFLDKSSWSFFWAF